MWDLSKYNLRQEVKKMLAELLNTKKLQDLDMSALKPLEPLNFNCGVCHVIGCEGWG